MNYFSYLYTMISSRNLIMTGHYRMLRNIINSSRTIEELDSLIPFIYRFEESYSTCYTSFLYRWLGWDSVYRNYKEELWGTYYDNQIRLEDEWPVQELY